MPKLTAAEVAEKHARRVKGASEDMRRGVEGVTENPMHKAAAKQEKYLAGVQRAVSSGKMKRGLMRTTTEQWKSAMINKGVGRVAAGIDEALPKTTAFFEELLPFQAVLQDQIKKMPDVTLEDGINRMTTFVRGMAKFQRKG